LANVFNKISLVNAFMQLYWNERGALSNASTNRIQHIKLNGNVVSPK
jgi:hypothetical protein